MKVLHITTADFGGAGLCVLRIHKSLLELGVDSKVLVAQKRSDLPTVVVAEESGLNTYVPPKNKWLRKFKKVLRRRGRFLTSLEKYQRSAEGVSGKALFTYPLSKYDLSNHPLVAEADVIHLHWVADFLDYPSFFLTVDKPIVWTLHDENIGLGGFHYKLEKERYYDLCQKTEDELWSIKQQALAHAKSRIEIIALSEMMKNYVESVPVIKDFPLSVIHNGVDDGNFAPIPKSFARQVFDISEHDLVFGFCSVNLSDKRKGLRELILALEQLKDDHVTLICAGEGEVPVPTKLRVVRTGAIQNERIMSLFYSVADYFIMPSYQEAFAQAPLEAMACGVPVVAFPCSGTKELINADNGVRCEEFTVESLLKGIREALGRQYDAEKIRKDVLTRFSPQVIANQYMEIYSRLSN